MVDSFFVSVGAYVSETHGAEYGIPQDSILSPVVFIIDMLPLGNIINHHHANYYFYADDTQLHISVSPNDSNALHNIALTLMYVWIKTLD